MYVTDTTYTLGHAISNLICCPHTKAHIALHAHYWNLLSKGWCRPMRTHVAHHLVHMDIVRDMQKMMQIVLSFGYAYTE